VNGKFMARLRSEAEGWLAIKCDFVDRAILLQAVPHVFHLTEHYQARCATFQVSSATTRSSRVCKRANTEKAVGSSSR
jgi:hypothetical protein